MNKQKHGESGLGLLHCQIIFPSPTSRLLLQPKRSFAWRTNRVSSSSAFPDRNTHSLSPTHTRRQSFSLANSPRNAHIFATTEPADREQRSAYRTLRYRGGISAEKQQTNLWSAAPAGVALPLPLLGCY